MYNWKFFSIIGALLVTFSRIYRRYLFNISSFSSEKSWYYICFGLFLGALLELSIKFKKIKTLEFSNNISISFIFVGFITFFVFKLFNIALYKAKNPGCVSATFAGLATLLTYFISIYLFNQKINFLKMLGVILTIAGFSMVIL